MSYVRKAIYACSPQTSRGQAVVLSADPKGEQFLYTNGRTVIIRNIKNPNIATEYTEHTCQTTVARWSPSGYYIASGDIQGNVRIWDTTQEEHILKSQSRPITGRINDLAWDFESKRLIAVGEGKERYGHAFAFDTSNSCGDIIGHSKTVNSCSIRNVRPFRGATGGDDLVVNFFNGPPFKFAKSINDHSRFVQCVRFSPDGALLVTVGSDAKIFIYDGSTGDKVGEILNGHTGGIFSVSFSPDSKHFVTSSADMTCKFWEVATRTCVNTVTFSGTVDDQQVGNLWAGSNIISLSLNGDLNYLDMKSPKPIRTLYSHAKGITAFAINRADSTFFTGSYDGRVYRWNTKDGSAVLVSGKGHTNQIVSLSVTKGNKVVSIGLDDTLRSLDAETKAFDAESLAIECAPKDLATFGDFSIVSSIKEVFIVQGGKKVSSVTPEFTPSAVAVSADGKEVAVGAEDHNVYLYTLQGTTLALKPNVLNQNRGAITSLAYSPDGKYLAAADTDRKVMVYSTADGELKFNEWVFHSARVNCIAWSPDSKHAVSGGLDRDIYVWSTEKPQKFVLIKGAHQDGVTGAGFADDSTVISVGADACVKVWSVTFH